MSTSISEEARLVLHELGLTQYEARAYLALLGKGVMTASQVSEYANVPYSKIYETLNSLERKGWIKTEGGRPSRYYPKPPLDVLEAAKLRLEDKMRTWKQIILRELQPIYERREIREKPDIWILRGEFSIIAKVREMLSKVRKELMIAAPRLTRSLMNAVAPMLLRVQSTRVRVLLMVSDDAKDWIGKEMISAAEVRIRDRMFGGGIIVDREEAMLFLGEEKPTLVIWSNHVGLVKFARDYFQYLWDSSRPYTL
ncbi:MAG: TrmB family transcriptional regulator [Candidatus Freyarchaeota archaeon]